MKVRGGARNDENCFVGSPPLGQAARASEVAKEKKHKEDIKLKQQKAQERTRKLERKPRG